MLPNMTLHLTHLDQPAKIDAAHLVSPRSFTPRGTYRHGFKRALDVLLVLLTLPISLPLVAIMAILVRFDGGQAFYTQSRIGKDGRHFKIWKLRTMVPDADALLQECLERCPKSRAEWDAKQKLKSDPRITTIGRVLRKTSMDELPQLLNVLTGTMSLVGPRPMMPSQRAQYHGQSYYHLRPGITGLWQISDRNESSFAARVSFDDMYYRSVSLKEDLKIIIRTFGVVLRGTGY
jgi:lipopolysaccharide/colanic/teichoic acid biosynthesis glycosyltransferase